MYSILFTIHSYVRWLVLLCLILSICRYSIRWYLNKSFSPFDKTLLRITAIMAFLQLTEGIWLYLVSPVTQYFLHHFNEAAHIKRIRFFGMEHISLMLLALIIIISGSIRVYHGSNHQLRFKTITIWFSIGLGIIIIAIPWKFYPLV